MARRRVTVGDLVAQWWDRHASSLASAESYAVQLDHRVLPQLAAHRVASVTTATVEEWIAWMRARGDGDPTIVKACTVLQSIMAAAIRDGIINVSPVVGAKKPSQRRTRTRCSSTPATWR